MLVAQRLAQLVHDVTRPLVQRRHLRLLVAQRLRGLRIQALLDDGF